MGAKQSTPSPQSPRHPCVPSVQFRVLIIGRANAGKTSILQRVCDTTESPVIYRSGPSGTHDQVCPHSQTAHSTRSWSIQVELEPTIEVGCAYSFSGSWSWISCRQRGHHNIEDEFIFTNHNGYVFHDSRGFEAGSEDELKIVQEFVTRKSREKQLRNRLHAIWLVL